MLTASFLFSAILLLGAAEPAPATRAFEAAYVGTIAEVPAGLSRLEGWIPVPSDSRDQAIHNVRVESPYPGDIRTEKEHGDRYFYFSTDKPKAGPLEIRVRFEAERREAGVARASTGPRESDADLQQYLRAESLVTLSPRIREIARQVTWGSTTPEAKARAIYDYIVSTMTYDKTTPGWGNGDTERACDVKRGNCTDIHSYFMSLARAEGIPARFMIGFPLKADAEGTVPGYHCWAEFYLPDKGWVPVDASDASKSADPRKRDYLFGHLDPDRIQFSIGRDIRLAPPPCAESLNYFIYPYVEGDGRQITPVAIRLEYKNRGASAAPAAASGGR